MPLFHFNARTGDKLLADGEAHGSGSRYLIQHSAGSGKSNSIAWLAHQPTGPCLNCESQLRPPAEEIGSEVLKTG